MDVRGMAAAALRRLTAADVNLLKCLLAASLYPNVSQPHMLTLLPSSTRAHVFFSLNSQRAVVHTMHDPEGLRHLLAMPSRCLHRSMRTPTGHAFIISSIHALLGEHCL